jgi:hypothetical protein
MIRWWWRSAPAMLTHSSTGIWEGRGGLGVAKAGSTMRLRRALLGLALALASLAAVYLAASILPVRLIDFEHYRLAAQMLWQGQSPYGQVEFFAPPWIALALGPLLLLPPNVAAAVWFLGSVLAACLTVVAAERWLGILPGSPRAGLLVVLALALSPAALFVDITGQISTYVGLAVIVLLWQAGERRAHPAVVAIALLIAAAKPHLVALPVLLGLLEIIRCLGWKSLRWPLAALILAAGLSFAFDRQWPAHLLTAWLGGDYRGGQPGLVSPGYVGLSELGAPAWLFVPHALYAVYAWWRHGLSARTAALALSVGLLLTPYTRSYDLVLLTLPLVALLAAAWRERRRGLAVLALAAFAWLLPLTTFSVLTPVIVTLGVLALPIHGTVRGDAAVPGG